jgi:hypothetical protein
MVRPTFGPSSEILSMTEGRRSTAINTITFIGNTSQLFAMRVPSKGRLPAINALVGELRFLWQKTNAVQYQAKP